MTTHNDGPARPVKPLPTKRVLAHLQIAVLRSVCLMTGPFTARDLEAATGIPAARAVLVMAFLRACGFAERAPGRGAYRPTKAATAMSRAWAQGEEAGLQAVRKAWKSSWFTLCAHSRLARGPALRAGLVAKLMTLSQVDASRRLEVEVLIDLMVAVGLLVPEDGGFLRWHTHPASQPSGPVPPVCAGAGDLEPSAVPKTGPGTSAAPAPDTPPVVVPAPRVSVDEQATDVTADLVALLSPPVLLADLGRLSAQDLLALHGHIRGLAALIAKLRSRPLA